MSQLRHPHIVQFLGVCYITGSPLPVLLMEKLQTSLHDLLETSPNIPLEVKVHLLTGTALGVVYLHSQNPPIAHRDLTARNILTDSELTAKIADLGMARIVDIQPGKLAATMSAAPGTNLYMPPEAVQGERFSRYNTTIDIFSFGVVSLFTLTQTFPKELKGTRFVDEQTQEIKGLSEIERREEYVQKMKTILGETHPLVKLTLRCLAYLPKDRPSAVDVSRQLEEVGLIILQNCTRSKLELIQQISRKENVITKKKEELEQIQVEHQRQLIEKDRNIHQVQLQLDKKVAQIDEIQIASKASMDHLQAECSVQQKLVLRLEEKMEEQRREIEQLRLLVQKLTPRENRSKGPKDMASVNKVRKSRAS